MLLIRLFQPFFHCLVYISVREYLFGIFIYQFLLKNISLEDIYSFVWNLIQAILVISSYTISKYMLTVKNKDNLIWFIAFFFGFCCWFWKAIFMINVAVETRGTFFSSLPKIKNKQFQSCSGKSFFTFQLAGTLLVILLKKNIFKATIQ